MCGIAGIVAYAPWAPPVDRHELDAIRESMANRGPDGANTWIGPNGRIGFAHRRLSIIDLSSAGDQPMFTADGRLAIVFNGEIYNYRAVRSKLEAKGYSFRSHSDTEVLLHAYAEYGRDMVHHLRGMYTIAIWDAKQHSLFLARDPFGIKPLYYCDDGGSFRFASQVKALRTSPNVDSTPDPAGHVGFFLWGFVPDPFTLHESIRALPAGHTLEIRDGRVGEPQRFFNLAEEFDAAAQLPRAFTAESREELASVMEDSVKHHMVADVPVGLFLSSGIDSTCLTSLASRMTPETLHTLTLGFDEYRGTHSDETALATKFADIYGVKNDVRWIGRENFAEQVDRIFAAMDQPTIDGVNTYLVSRAAASAGMKVALSGLGGDELFGSYPSFKDVPRVVKLASGIPGLQTLGRGFRAISAPLLKQFTSPKYASLFEYGGSFEGAYLLRRGLFMPWELPDLLDPDMIKAGWERLAPLARVKETVPQKTSAYCKVSALETSWYMRSQLLRDSDWAGMANSLEIRVPMVDVDLFRKLVPYFASDQRPTKRDLVTACAGPNAEPLLSRQKSGFSVPVERWIRELHLTQGLDRGLRDWARTVFTKHVPHSARLSNKRVLTFRIGNLGDTLISLPAIHAIRQQHPGASHCLLTNEEQGNAKMVSTWRVVKPLNLFDSSIQYATRNQSPVSLFNLLGMIARLRRFNPGTAYYLSPRRTSWQQKRDRFFFRVVLGIEHLVLVPDSELPAKDSSGELPRLQGEWKRLARIVGEDGGLGEGYCLLTAQQFRMEALKSLHGFTNSGEILVAIAPSSKMPAKVWPRDRFESLGQQILETYPDAKLIVLGGPEDKNLGDALCATWGQRSRNLAGTLSIFGSAETLRHCALYVGNDTGTMHLAAMVGTPCVALFSARDYPGLWEPMGNHHIVLRKNVSCSGCMLETCEKEQMRCLTGISTSETYDAVAALLHQVGASKEVVKLKMEAAA